MTNQISIQNKSQYKVVFLIIHFIFSLNSLYADCTDRKNVQLTISCTYGCRGPYRLAIENAAKRLGHNIKFVSLNRDHQMRGHQAELADGVLIEGGADILPGLYEHELDEGQLTALERETIRTGLSVEDKKLWSRKDLLEYSFLQDYFFKEKFKKLPLLGICRGMQMMTVANHIPLYPDLSLVLQQPVPRMVMRDIDVIDSTGHFGKMVNGQNVRVFSNHHQGLNLKYYNEHKDEHPMLKIVATSYNGQVVEGIEFKNRTALGVQFHPEQVNNDLQIQIFDWYLQRVYDYKCSKEN